MRRLSWRFVPITRSPPSSVTPPPSWMSTPRPAMFVDMVTAPRWPARATMAASSSSLRALSTECGRSSSDRLRRSDSSTLQAELKLQQARFDLTFTQRQLLANLSSYYLEANVASSQMASLKHSLDLRSEE